MEEEGRHLARVWREIAGLHERESQRRAKDGQDENCFQPIADVYCQAANDLEKLLNKRYLADDGTWWSPTNRLYLTEWVCSIAIAIFGLEHVWSGGRSGFFGVEPAWLAQLEAVALITLVVYVLGYLLTAIAWAGVTVGLLKRDDPLQAIHQYFATVLIVLALIALLFFAARYSGGGDYFMDSW